MAAPKIGDRVKVTAGEHINKFGNVWWEHAATLEVEFDDGTLEHISIHFLIKVAPNAGKPKPKPVVLSNEAKMYMLGAVALTSLRENPTPEKYMETMRRIATEMGEL